MKDSNKKKNRRINLRVDDDLYKVVKGEVERRGMTIAAYCKFILYYQAVPLETHIEVKELNKFHNVFGEISTTLRHINLLIKATENDDVISEAEEYKRACDSVIKECVDYLMYLRGMK